MYSKFINIVLLFMVLFAPPCVAQTESEIQKQREAFEERAMQHLHERIQTFLINLDADDFQKEIIKQKLLSYFDKKQVLYMDGSLKYYERDGHISSLDASHFSDIENMITEETMSQIKVFIIDAGSTLDKQNKKKNKNKKNKE